MALAKVHHFLIDEGIRLKASLVVVSGEIRDSHDLACHIAYGASAVWPYLALERVRQLSLLAQDLNLSPEEAQENYSKALNKGLLKIMSKMGISTVRSYIGSQIFESIGLSKEFVDEYFTWTANKIGGVDERRIKKDMLQNYLSAFKETKIPEELELVSGLKSMDEVMPRPTPDAQKTLLDKVRDASMEEIDESIEEEFK